MRRKAVKIRVKRNSGTPKNYIANKKTEPASSIENPIESDSPNFFKTIPTKFSQILYSEGQMTYVSIFC